MELSYVFVFYFNDLSLHGGVVQVFVSAFFCIREIALACS